MFEQKKIIRKLNSLKPEIKRLYRGTTTTQKGHVLRYLESYYHRFSKMIEMIVEGVAPEKDKKVLDIGIAYGFYGIVLREVFGFEVVGMELPQYISKYCALCKKHKIDVKAGNLMEKNLPFEKHQFDAIILGEIIEHIPLSPYLMFKKLKPYLKKDGIILVTVPNIAHKRNIKRLLSGQNVNEKFSREVNLTQKIDSRTHVREYDRFELAKDLTDAGFLVEKIEMVDSDADVASLFTKLFPKYKKYIMIRARGK